MRQLFFWISKIELRFCVLAPITTVAAASARLVALDLHISPWGDAWCELEADDRNTSTNVRIIEPDANISLASPFLNHQRLVSCQLVLLWLCFECFDLWSILGVLVLLCWEHLEYIRNSLGEPGTLREIAFAHGTACFWCVSWRSADPYHHNP